MRYRLLWITLGGIIGGLLVCGMPATHAQAQAGNAVKPPDLTYLWAKAYHILPETHNNESGYSSLCIGRNGKVYVGTAKYGVNAYATCPVKSVLAGEIEQAVVAQLRRFFTTPEMIAMTARTAQALTEGTPLREQDVARHLGQLDGVWDELFPVEQARLLQLMVKQVTVSEHGLDVQMHADGLYSLINELQGDETE